MTKNTTIALVLALAGCATTPHGQKPRPVSASNYGYKRPSVDAVWRDACYALGDFEPVVRRARANGFSIEQSRAIIALAALETGDINTQRTKISGTLMFMTIRHVYEGRTDSVASRCLDERWPQTAYVITL